MLPGPTTVTWPEYKARAELHNSVDAEWFLDRIKAYVDPDPHLAITGGAFGKEEHWYGDDYYFTLKFKSDLPAEEADSAMRRWVFIAEPTLVQSWLMMAPSVVNTTVSVYTGVADDAIDKGAEIKDSLGKVANVAAGIGDAVPGTIGNLHWILLGAGVLALGAVVLYAAPILAPVIAAARK